MRGSLVTGAIAALISITAAQAQSALAPEDEAAIEALTARYAEALGSCDATGFADLFVPETGYFASGFRGQMVGRERLIALVESERHCNLPPDTPPAARPARSAPSVTLEVTADGVRGVADLGAVGSYQDEYVKTPDGWRFASRTVVTKAESDAGLTAEDLVAIQRLSGDELGDHYVANDAGGRRLLTSGVAISVASGKITGRAYLRDGGHYEDVYEKTPSGEWRIASRVKVPAQGEAR